MSDISPEIAAMLDSESSADSIESVDAAEFDKPSISTFSSFKVPEVDLTKAKFAPIEKYFSDTPLTQVFNDKTYYKTGLSNECEMAGRLHNLLSKYLTCKDPKDKTVFRQQIVTPYWEVMRSIASKMVYADTPECKRMMLRYGVLLPSLFTPEQKEMFSKVFINNNYNEPVYYLDEWFTGIAKGAITLSATDEARVPAKGGGSAEEKARLNQLKTKNQGKIQNADTMLTSKENERRNVENQLASELSQFCEHGPLPGCNHKSNLSDAQKRMATNLVDKIKLLMKIDKEITAYIKDLQDAQEIGKTLDQKITALASGDSSGLEVNNADFNTEFDTVRQMAKMSVGRMGNHFPVFTREFFHCIPKDTGFRENVIRELAWVESLDPNAFCRIHKNVQNRIVPYVILVPTYGDFGFCWEPFDRFNRVTSRGRIIVPMYPKNLRTAVLLACGDLRWQVAKEKASYYWMEEGLTGQYYQWFAAQKLKGDVKDKFIEDYILWMRNESEGMMKLEKEVRAIFWRYLPFPQERKEMLRTRSLVYQELYQRDLNRTMSDGY
ncbi:MAG: hypothetical protein K5839_04175 [Treponemataceae bacterium]|nr:hypothetical protein [Treponemataceae bacterium]